MSASIRAAVRDDDILAVAEIHAASWQHAYRGILPASYLDGLRVPELAARWHQRVRAQPRHRGLSRDVWLVEERGEVAGFALLGPCRDGDEVAGFAGEVLMLYVHPRRTGRGLGRRLLTHAMDTLARRQYFWSVVWVLEKNRRAQEFYLRMGLRPDGARRWDRFAGRAVPVIRYARALNPIIDFDALCRNPRSYA